jgi:hypothetical protein
MNNTAEQQERYRRALRRAQEIIDESWLETGVTREELEQNKQVAELLDRLVADGRSVKGVLAEWEGKSAEEVLRAYGVEPFHEATTLEPMRQSTAALA